MNIKLENNLPYNTWKRTVHNFSEFCLSYYLKCKCKKKEKEKKKEQFPIFLTS